MADSSKGLDFYTEPMSNKSRPSVVLENPTPPKICDQPADASMTEQAPSTKIVQLKRMYEAIEKDTANELSGEEIMRKYGFARHRDLESFFYEQLVC